MSLDAKVLIRSRAELIGRYAARMLTEAGDDDSAIEPVDAFRYSYLMLRRPRAFARQFAGTDLAINEDEFERFLWHSQEKIPGLIPSRLLQEEREIIRYHNAQVAALDAANTTLALSVPTAQLSQ